MSGSEGKSYREILRSTSVIGGASTATVVVGLVRTKIAAYLVGPVGVGLIGLFVNLMATAAAAVGLGLGNVGTRRIAEVTGSDDPHALAHVRRALFWATVAVALAGGVIVWAARRPLARWLLGDAGQANRVGWLAVGVVMLVATASQTALLNGLRRIGDLARVSVWGSLVSAIAGVAAIWIWREDGLVAFAVATPCATFVIAAVYVSRLPRVEAPRTSAATFYREWNGLARLGTAFMLAGLAGTLAQLLVRGAVQRTLGAAALGHFQASWAISMTYTGFVLQAMATDYYPRLSAVARDAAATNSLVNQQTEVALLLAGPVFLVTAALAPWIISLLYSAKFAEAATVLRWQVLGDVLRIASWPLGFAILAAGRGKTYLATEICSAIVLFGVTDMYVARLGVVATGYAFVAMYAAYLPLVYLLARRRTGFAWSRGVSRQVAALMVTLVVVLLVCRWREIAGAALGIVTAMGFAMLGLMRLARMAQIEGRIGRAAVLSRRGLQLVGIGRD